MMTPELFSWRLTEGRSPRIPALLRFLVSPRNLTRSPYRFTEHPIGMWNAGEWVVCKSQSYLSSTTRHRRAERRIRARFTRIIPLYGDSSGGVKGRNVCVVRARTYSQCVTRGGVCLSLCDTATRCDTDGVSLVGYSRCEEHGC